MSTSPLQCQNGSRPKVTNGFDSHNMKTIEAKQKHDFYVSNEQPYFETNITGYMGFKTGSGNALMRRRVGCDFFR